MTAPEQMRADAWVKPYCDWRRDVGIVVGDQCSPETGFQAGWQAALSTRPATDELVEALRGLLAVAEMTTFSDQYPRECEAARTALRNTGAVS